MLTWQAHAGAVTSVAFVPGGGLLSTGTDGYFRSWDVASGSESLNYRFATAAETPLASNLMKVLVDSTGRHAVVGLRDSGVEFLGLSTGAVDPAIRYQQVHALTIDPVASSFFLLARNEYESQARVWQISFADAKVLARSEDPPNGSLHGLAISPDGSQVIAGRNRFAWPSGKRTGPVSLATGHLFAVSHDGDKLFGANGTRLMVWGMQTGALRHKIKGHVAPITGMTTTPDGRKLWTCSADATVRQWDVDTYRCTQCYGLKVGPLGCVAVSPDGLTAAAGSAHNGHIAVWDLD